MLSKRISDDTLPVLIIKMYRLRFPLLFRHLSKNNEKSRRAVFGNLDLFKNTILERVDLSFVDEHDRMVIFLHPPHRKLSILPPQYGPQLKTLVEIDQEAKFHGKESVTRTTTVAILTLPC